MPSAKSRPPAAESGQGSEPPVSDSEVETIATEDPGPGGTEREPQVPGGDDDLGATFSGWWRFGGAYPCAYTTPDRVSQWIQPGQVVAWPDGPPDTNWEPVPEPEPAPAVSDQNTEE